VKTGTLCYGGGDLELYSRRNSPDPATEDFLVVNTSSESVVETTYNFGLIESGGEVAAGGDLNGSLFRGDGADVTLTRDPNPTIDPNDFTIDIDYGPPGNLHQSQSWMANWVETGPTLRVFFADGGRFDPQHDFDDPRGLFKSTEVSEDVRMTAYVVNMPVGIPLGLGDLDIQGVTLDSASGANFSLTTPGSVTLSVGESYLIQIDAQVQANQFGANVVVDTALSGDRITIPIAGNTTLSVLRLDAPNLVRDPGTDNYAWSFSSTELFKVSSNTLTLTNDSPDPDVAVLLAGNPRPVQNENGRNRSVTFWTDDFAPTVGAGDLLLNGTPGTVTYNFSPDELGLNQGSTPIPYFTAKKDGNGNFVTGSIEESINLNFRGRGEAGSTFNFTDPVFDPNDPDTVCIEFPVVKDLHYVMEVSDDGKNFKRLEFEKPPTGSGMVQDFTTAPTTKDDFKVFIHGRSGKPTGIFRVECHDRLRVVSTVINDGQMDGAQLRKICLFLNLASNLDELCANSTIDDAVKVIKASTGAELDLNEGVYRYDPALRKVTINLETLTSDPAAPLVLEEGHYNISLNTDLIHLAHQPTSGLLEDDGNFDGLHVIDGRRATSTVFYGDADLDGSVGASDLNQLALNWQMPVPRWTGGDFNGDEIVNAADLNILGENWQKNVPP